MTPSGGMLWQLEERSVGADTCKRTLFPLYQGTLTPLLGVGLCVSIQFGVVERVKREFASRNARAAGVPQGAESLLGIGPKAFPLTSPQLYAAGVSAGVANSFVAGPVEHIRIRLQTQATQIYSGPLDCARK